MAHQLLAFPSDAELAKNAAANWLAQLRARNNPASNYTVALSGGRIVKTFFEELASQSQANSPAPQTCPAIFSNVHFFWADERCVPPTDPESNYASAKKLLFDPLKVPAAQINRLRGEGPEPLALKEAEDALLQTAKLANNLPIFDMIFLGMGEDGHVASLFPGEPEVVIASAAVYRAVTAVKPPPRRITLGYGVIAAAREVWVIASGAGKESALKESLLPNGKTPLSRVLRQRAQTTILTDITPR
jgi:6-phosphogluconolactonase